MRPRRLRNAQSPLKTRRQRLPQPARRGLEPHAAPVRTWFRPRLPFHRERHHSIRADRGIHWIAVSCTTVTRRPLRRHRRGRARFVVVADALCRTYASSTCPRGQPALARHRRDHDRALSREALYVIYCWNAAVTRDQDGAAPGGARLHVKGVARRLQDWKKQGSDRARVTSGAHRPLSSLLSARPNRDGRRARPASVSAGASFAASLPR